MFQDLRLSAAEWLSAVRHIEEPYDVVISLPTGCERIKAVQKPEGNQSSEILEPLELVESCIA